MHRPVGELTVTTRVHNSRNDQSGDLLRLVHGQPLVRYDGDRTEYLTTWRGLSVTSSDEYLLPEGDFHRGLLVDANGDVWRVRSSSTWGSRWPCEDGGEHFHGERGTLCWNCSQVADTELRHEVVTLVAAEGYPAQSARPQTRAEVEEWTGGPLFPIGSPEALERARREGQRPADRSSVTAMGWGVGVLAVMILAVVVIAVVRLL